MKSFISENWLLTLLCRHLNSEMYIYLGICGRKESIWLPSKFFTQPLCKMVPENDPFFYPVGSTV